MTTPDTDTLAGLLDRLNCDCDQCTFLDAREAILALRAQAAKDKARIERLEAAASLTRRADDLREAYHRLPNDHNRIGDKRSKKGHARDAWLRAFRKAAAASRAALEAGEDALAKALREIANCGQSAEPDHWKFRCMAREKARAALAAYEARRKGR